MPHLSRLFFLALCDDQLLPLLYTNRWTICMIGTWFLKTIVQFSIITTVLGLAKLPLALLPLPFSQRMLDDRLIHVLGGVALLLVLRDLSNLIIKKTDVKLSTSLTATEEPTAQEESFEVATDTETVSTINIQTSDPSHDVTVEQVIDDSSDEGELGFHRVQYTNLSIAPTQQKKLLFASP